jgi:voltage-gated potassium channel Kch
MPNAVPFAIDRFLVCGLGSLGQYCVLSLKKFALSEFEVQVTAIDKVSLEEWEIPNFPDLLMQLPIIGDCRREEVLLKAGVKDCRAILLVTDNESVNIEAAIAARRLNPKIRLIVRSSRQSLNQLLKTQLGDFVALEPTELPAPAFALAGMQAGILGFFDIGPYRFQVVQQQVMPKDYRFDGFPTALLHKRSYRLLSYTAAQASSPEVAVTASRAFYQWQADTRIHAGDTIAYIEAFDQLAKTQRPDRPAEEQWWRQLQQPLQNLLIRGNFKQQVRQFWQWIQAQQTRQIISAGLLTAMLLWILGAIVLKAGIPQLSLSKAISGAVILLLGGYGDLFGGLADEPFVIPWWVHVVSLFITLLSFLFVLGVLGLIAERIISSRLDFLKKRPPIPKQGHVVLVGFGRVGQRIARILQDFRQPLIALTEQSEQVIPTRFPLLVGNLMTELNKVNLAAAKSIIVVTEDEMLNLEVALRGRESAQQLDRQIGLVVRSYDQRFCDNLADLLPDIKVLVAYALSAEAFAGAAFGENILGLFQLHDQTVLVTEYAIAAGDTLAGKLLAQVAYGYGVVPIFHHAGEHLIEETEDCLLPSDDRVLRAGDRLIVLATINGLRRIERGAITSPHRWRLEAQRPLNNSFLLESGSDLARISGCHLDEARRFMDQLPGAIELRLYDYQAHRLAQELGRKLPIQLSLIK